MRYWILAAGLAVLMLAETLQRRWIGDFWEHAAVVRALAAHPLSPSHPLLAVDQPHAFFSPYALAVGLTARVTGCSPATALSVAGMFNLALLVFALRRFVQRRFSAPHADFYALLFTLVLWGYPTVLFSGMLSLQWLGNVLGYPSTFATGLLLLVWSLALEGVFSRGRVWLLTVCLGTLILTHPPTALGAGVGLLAFTVEGAGGRLKPALIRVALLGAIAMLLALAWPYYPLTGVLRDGHFFHESNRAMYAEALGDALPALAGLPLLALRLRNRWRDGLGLVFLALFAVYLAGAFSGQWSWGRVLPVLVLALHLVAADFAARMEAAWRSQGTPLSNSQRAGGWLLAAVVLFCAARFTPEVIRPFRDSPRFPARYEPLTRWVGENDVVVADLVTSWYLPAYCGKVVASIHPLAFVPDQRERGEDLRRFFHPKAGLELRRSVIARQGARFVLLDRTEVDLPPGAEAAYRELGRVVHEQHPLVLIEVTPTR